MAARHGGQPLLLAVFRGVPGTAQLEAIADRAAGASAGALAALVGHGSPHGVDARALVRAVRAAAADLPRADVLAVPLPAHPELGPAGQAALRRSVLTAYGATEVLDMDPAARAELPAASRAELERLASRRGIVVLLTGLSGSGKSTIASALVDELADRGEREVTLLDGDEVRLMLSAGLGFSRADRDINVRRIGYVASLLARHGGIAVCAPIAPYAAARTEVRTMGRGRRRVPPGPRLHAAGGVRGARPQGPLRQGTVGPLPAFTGVSDPYEEPADADLALDTSVVPLDKAVEQIVEHLEDRGLVRAR